MAGLIKGRTERAVNAVVAAGWWSQNTSTQVTEILMSNLSVKLDASTQARLKTLAAREGVTPHALMVRAICRQFDDIEARHSFVERALQAQAHAQAGGGVYEGPAYADYLRSKVHAGLGEQSGCAEKPKPTSLTAFVEPR